MHHPPMPLGLPMQDTENMKDGDAFLNLISAYESVKYLFIGHVHRPITGTIRGLPFSTMRSILYQAPAPWPEWNWDTFMPSEEAPNIGILTIAGASVYTQRRIGLASTMCFALISRHSLHRINYVNKGSNQTLAFTRRV